MLFIGKVNLSSDIATGQVADRINAENGILGVANVSDRLLSVDRLLEMVKNMGYTPKLKWIRGRKPSLTTKYEDVFLRW